MITITQAINDAADEIERRGWYRDRRPSETVEQYKIAYKHSEASTCAGLAISTSDAARAFVNYLGLNIEGIANTLDAIYEWNDSQESGDVVVAKLREAAAYYAGREGL